MGSRSGPGQRRPAAGVVVDGKICHLIALFGKYQGVLFGTKFKLSV